MRRIEFVSETEADGYMGFRDQYHVQKALEENSPAKRRDYQITEEKRENPDVRTRPTTADRSIKEREAAGEREERKDYPEVTPTAMSNFVCDRCGKPFQNRLKAGRVAREQGGTVMPAPGGGFVVLRGAPQ